MTANHGHSDSYADERDLLDRLSRGDVTAFDAVYRKYAQAVHRNASLLLKDALAAEDVVQETFLSLWRCRTTMAGRDSAGGWLFITMHNRCVNMIKRRLGERKARLAWLREEHESENHTVVIDKSFSLVATAMENLSHRQHQAFTLCKIQGKSYVEAAGIMAVSKHTLKEYLSLAMRSIRAFLKERAVRTMLHVMALTARFWVGW